MKNYKFVDTAGPSDYKLTYHWSPVKGTYHLAFISGHDYRGPSSPLGLQSCRAEAPLSSDKAMDLVLRLQSAIVNCDLRNPLVESLATTPSTINEPSGCSTAGCSPTLDTASMVLYSFGCMSRPSYFTDPQYISGGTCGAQVKIKSSMLVSSPTRTYFIEYSLTKQPDGSYELSSILIYRNTCLNPVDLVNCGQACLEPGLSVVTAFQQYMAQAGKPPAPLAISTTNTDTCTNGLCCMAVDSTTESMFMVMGLDGLKPVNSAIPVLQTSCPTPIYLATTSVGLSQWTIRYTLALNPDGYTYSISKLDVFTPGCPLPAIGTPYGLCSACMTSRTIDAVAVAAQLQLAASACSNASPLVLALGLTTQVRTPGACETDPGQCCNSIDPANAALYMDLFCTQHGTPTPPAFISSDTEGNTVYAGSSIVANSVTYTIEYVMTMNLITGLYEITLIKIGTSACPINDTYPSCTQCMQPSPAPMLMALNSAVSSCQSIDPLVIDLGSIPSTISTPCLGSIDYCCPTTSSNSTALYDLSCWMVLYRSISDPVLITGVVGDTYVTYQSTLFVENADGTTLQYTVEYTMAAGPDGYAISSILIYDSRCTNHVDFFACNPSCINPAVYAVESFQSYLALPDQAPLFVIVEISAYCVSACCMTSLMETASLYAAMSIDGTSLVTSTAPVLEPGSTFSSNPIYMLGDTTVNGVTWTLRYTLDLDADGLTYNLGKIQAWQAGLANVCPFNIFNPSYPECGACIAPNYLLSLEVILQLELAAKSCENADPLVSALGSSTTVIVTSTCSGNPAQCCNSITPANAAVYMTMFCSDQPDLIDIEIIARNLDDTLVTLSSSQMVLGVPREIGYVAAWNWASGTYDVMQVKIETSGCPASDLYPNCVFC